MRMASLIIGAVLLTGAAHAQYGYGHQTFSNCESIKNDNRLGGALAGALIGGLAGGAIGNNVDGGDYVYTRPGRYHHRHRGHRRHGRRHGYYRYEDDNSDEVVVGAVLGAIVGGVAGAAIGDSTTDCNPRRYAGVAPPTRSAYGSGWNAPRRVTHQPYHNSDYRYESDELHGGGFREHDYSNEPPFEGAGRECMIVQRTTVLPDGQRLREDVQACRDTPYDDWALQD